MFRAFLPPTGLAAGPLAAVLFSVSCASAQTRATSSAPAGSPEGPAASAPAVPAQASAWLVSDSAGQVVTIALQVTPAPDGGAALINGRRNGELQVVVPLNWTVQWDWRSADSTAPHSLVVMAEREKLPTEGGRAAFTNAMTRMVTAGLRPGQGDRTTFTPDEVGWYWLLCGVPGHALAGEYIGLRVDPDARTAYIKPK
jgi:hypothetical protein